MTDRKLFYLFYGAREGKEDIMKQAVDAGADINFPFNGRKGTRGSAGRWYYGDTIWYCPDGVDGHKGDSLLHIAIKTGNVKLMDWLMSFPNIDLTCKNSVGLDPVQLATSIEKDETLKIKFKSFESNLKLLERNGNETKVEIE